MDVVVFGPDAPARDDVRTGRLRPARSEIGRTEPGRPEPDRLQSGRLEPDRAEADRAEADRAEADRAEADRAGPGRAGSSGAEPESREPDASTGPRRHGGLTVVAVLAAVAATAALRAGVEPVERRERTAAAAVEDSVPAPVRTRPPVRTAPFDHLPGRTPIPEPWLTVDQGRLVVRGDLPPSRAPSQRAAETAARLVLGRYCRVPRAFRVRVVDGGGWLTVTAVVLRQAHPGPRQLTTVDLRWTGQAYRWQGTSKELTRCG
jgi:hypothetical protein